MPTTIILRFSDDTIDDITKVKYHKWLNEKIPDLQLPESEEEENLDSQSDSKYESVTKYLRIYANSHREQFPRVYQELKKYNYWRNLYGCKWYALSIYAILTIREGIEKEAPKSKRHKLVNPYYFCRTSYGEENSEFWDEVYEYISNHYDLDKVKKIYLSSDGGTWIKSGMKRIAGITYVLDEFHLEKYLIKLTSHMKDSREDALDELRTAIRSKTKQDFEEIVDRLKDCLENEAGLKRIAAARDYILSNWMAAKLRLRHQNGVKGSSTEGHVSHVLSSRMSSRPMG